MDMHPRWIKNGSIYALPQRTVDRQFLFRPDPFVRNNIGASAARALKKHPFKLFWLEFNINHEHRNHTHPSRQKSDPFSVSLSRPAPFSVSMGVSAFETKITESLPSALKGSLPEIEEIESKLEEMH